MLPPGVKPLTSIVGHPRNESAILHPVGPQVIERIPHTLGQTRRIGRSQRGGLRDERSDHRYAQDVGKHFPLIVSSGRLVEYEGGGEETRSNKWLAELQQDMFIEISPADAAERGIKDGGWVWVTGAENSAKAKMKALVTERVGRGVTWMPFHFGGWFGGEDLRSKYPSGTDPIVLGESANTIMTYGYDPATGMQEPKVSLCQVRAA